MVDSKSKGAPAGLAEAADNTPPTTDGNTRPAAGKHDKSKHEGKHEDDDKLKAARAAMRREDKLEPEKTVTADDPDIIIEPTGEISRNRPAEQAPDLSGLDPKLEPDVPPSVDDPDIIIEPTGEVSRNRAAERAQALLDDNK